MNILRNCTLRAFLVLSFLGLFNVTAEAENVWQEFADGVDSINAFYGELFEGMWAAAIIMSHLILPLLTVLAAITAALFVFYFILDAVLKAAASCMDTWDSVRAEVLDWWHSPPSGEGL